MSELTLKVFRCDGCINNLGVIPRCLLVENCIFLGKQVDICGVARSGHFLVIVFQKWSSIINKKHFKIRATCVFFLRFSLYRILQIHCFILNVYYIQLQSSKQILLNYSNVFQFFKYC